MSDEIGRLLKNGSELIVQTWTDKVTSDRRVQSDKDLSYLQLIDHIPEIVEELHRALQGTAPATPLKGEQHGRQRWRQGYELKEVMRELMLLRATLLEFIETYYGAMHMPQPEQLMQSYRRINNFMDEELYRTVEAYLESAQGVTAEV